MNDQDDYDNIADQNPDDTPEKRRGRRVSSTPITTDTNDMTHSPLQWDTSQPTVSTSAQQHTGKQSFADLAQADDFSLMDAIGGWRGIAEAVLPSLLFLVFFLTTHQLGVAVLVSGLISVLFVGWRLVKKEQLKSAIFGLILACIYLCAAWFSHSAKNYYLPAFILDFGAVIVLLLSNIVRIPLMGAFVEIFHTPLKGGFKNWLTEWKSDTLLYKAYRQTTYLWMTLFTFRLIVEVPFYFANNVNVLGILHLALGVPLYALVAWLSWVFISPEIKRVDRERRS